jgi:hypothetical protein
LAIVKRPAINMGMKVSLLYIDYTPLDICPKVLWQGHTVGLFLVWGTSIQISMQDALAYIPTKSK